MKKSFVYTLVLVLFLCTQSVAFADTGAPALVVESQNLASGSENSVVRPAGRWTTVCTPLHTVVITWTTEMKFGGEIFTVKALFDNFGPRFDKRQLPDFGKDPGKKVAFRFMKDEYSSWLYMMADGRLDPSQTGFEESVTVSEFPGGYPVLAEEILSSGVAWDNLYAELKGAAEKIREGIDVGSFCPAPTQKKKQWGDVTI